MKYLTPILVLAMLTVLAGCSSGGISEAFSVKINLLPAEGETPLPVTGTVEIEGGSSTSLSDYTFAWRIPSVPSFSSSSSTFSYMFAQVGIFRVDVTITDKNTGQVVHTFTTVTVNPDLEELHVMLDFLYPDEDEDGKAPIGKAPFILEMGAIVTGGEEPYFYEWDFNTDGKSEASGTDLDSFKGTLASPGTYQVSVNVTDARNTTVSDHRFVHVLPSNPIAVAHALPPEGPVGLFGLYVVFSATGSYDPDGQIVLYEWDFDNDGVYDWSSPVTGSTSNGYTEPGNYYPTLRVTDNDGLQGLATTQVIVTF
jgi:hypothetical protein